MPQMLVNYYQNLTNVSILLRGRHIALPSSVRTYVRTSIIRFDRISKLLQFPKALIIVQVKTLTSTTPNGCTLHHNRSN